MHKELRPEQVDILVGSSPVNTEFSNKVRELDRRLRSNGMSYRDWESLNDRQHDIFTDNLFLDGECASSPEQYVKGAVASCGCPDTEEELHHHSPVLMREIEKQQDMLPDMTVKIGESLNNLNGFIDLVVENLLTEVEDSANTLQSDVNELWCAFRFAGDNWSSVQPGDAQAAMENREKEMAERYGEERAAQLIDLQKGRAEASVEAVLEWANANGFGGQPAKVFWTARPGILEKAVKSVDPKATPTEDNPTDVLLQFGGKGIQSLLGVSLKSTKQMKGEIAFQNMGGNYVSDKESPVSKKRPWPRGLSSKGGDEVWADIKAYERYTFSQLLSQIQIDPKAADIKNALDACPSGTCDIENMNKKERDALLKHIKERTHPTIPKEVQAKIFELFWQTYATDYKFYYRDKAFRLLQKLTPEELTEHVLRGLLRVDMIPLTIKATGRGKPGNFTATIKKEELMPDWLANLNKTGGWKVVKIGKTPASIQGGAPGTGPPLGQGEVGAADPAIGIMAGNYKVLKIRIKFAGRPFATSIKPTADGW